MMKRSCLSLLALALAGCPQPPPPSDVPVDAADTAVVNDGGDAPDASPPRNILETVPARETWRIPSLTSDVEVIRTAGNVPHIYGSNTNDMARVHGFIMARDRYFVLEMARRLSQGKLSKLFGDAALNTDMESRGTAMTAVTDKVLSMLTPAQTAQLDAYCEGVNFYIEQVRARIVSAPSEFDLAAPLLGRRNPADLMEPFARRDMVAIMATFIYQLGFETDDVGHTDALEHLLDNLNNIPLEALRRAGARRDVFDQLKEPVNTTSSAGFGTEGPNGLMTLNSTRSRTRRAPPGHSPRDLLASLSKRLERIETRLGRVDGFGSNAWAVNAAGTRDGSSLLAGDGHLSLSVPALFYQIGFDTTVLGNGDTHQMGLIIPGMPVMAVGTNGSVAWCQTQLSGDITDWYREEIKLNAQGVPVTSLFQGQDRPLVRTDEVFEVANIVPLNSVGRTETWPRFVTFDGRWITQIEGRTVTASDTLMPGETKVMVLGQLVVPKDMNNDGKITAVSFDYTALDGSNLTLVLDKFGHSNNINEFREATKGLVAYSQNIVASDSAGSILYTSYQAVPCRNNLRVSGTTGPWQAGGDPKFLLDGTRFGGFTIPITNNVVDETQGATDPSKCVIPFNRIPQALNPARGWVQTANNDPAPITEDNDLTNDPFYIGGPWNDGFRGDRIGRRLTEYVTARTADEDAMSAIQADVRSPVGERLAPELIAAIAHARAAAMQTPPPAAGTADARLAALYTASQADYDDVSARLTAWGQGATAYQTPSGVETFYHTPGANDRVLSVATTIFNSWMGRYMRKVFDDERLPGGAFDGNTGRMRTITLILAGRGAAGQNTVASWNPATQESAYFDILDTPTVETSHEVALLALDEALAFLRSAPTSAGRGGYGTSDKTQWLWGLRHHTRFDSILADFLGNSPSLAPLVENFSITPRQLPLAMNLPAGDPRADLPGFPRPGDLWVVDAANSGMNGESFTFGSGPNFRMVIALKGNTMRGRNVLPGGQSGLKNSAYFSDQARMWLGNQTMPMHLAPTEVVANAIGREAFRPPQ